MLHFIRERAQGWIAWVIVGLVSATFALFGVNSYLTGSSEVITAKVNGEPIRQVEFQRALQQYRDRMREMLGENFDPAVFDGLAIRQSVLDGLIEQKLLLAANNALGQRIADIDINIFVQNTPAFQSDGQFDPERYRATLARANFNPASYESQLRVDLLAQELTNNIQQTAVATSDAVDNVLRLEKQTRDIAYGVVSAQAQVDQVVVTDEDIRSFYGKNINNYMAPERLSVDYVELSVDELAKTVEVDETDLQQFYGENEDQFVGPEQRRISHIMIEGDEAEALPVLTTLKQRLANGEQFVDLAAEFSHDSGSANDGGDLGLFQDKDIEPAFKQAVFSMAIDDISEPIKTESGYHLVKLTEIKAPEGKSFADARSQVEVLFRRGQAEELFYEQAEQLADLSYENPDDLMLVAEELSLEIKTSATFTRNGGSGIFADKKVLDMAFNDDVLNNDLNSVVIELSKSHLVVLHKNTHIPASQLPFESIAPAITDQLKFEYASDKAREQGEAILSKLESDLTTEELFADNDWHGVQTYSRVSSDISAQVIQHAFAMTKPSANATFSGFTANNGNYIVVKLTAVNDGDPADATAQDRDGLRSYLTSTHGTSELRAFMASLKADADIKIIAKNLK